MVRKRKLFDELAGTLSPLLKKHTESSLSKIFRILKYALGVILKYTLRRATQ